MRDTTITDEVEALEGLDLHGLRAVWRERYGAPPKLRSVELLGLMLAWRLQVEAAGGLSPEARRAIRRPVGEKASPTAAAGARLVREWGGVRHEATAIADGGFLYSGERFASLSQIARRITGVRWNGPRFFGLRTGKLG